LSARKVQEEAQRDVENQATDDMDDSMNDFVLRTSISVMGADERAALDRMRLSSEPISTTVSNILQNPHFAFILVTLILGSAAYFYSRHKEQMDDVT
jgi:cytochrome P450